MSAINAVMGTAIAWVLVRDRFPGKSIVNAVIDLPFALPTIVAGLVLLALYGPESPIGIDVAYTRTAVVLALLFVTLPFVVRSVQPVLLELDREMEEAAESLGARPFGVFRRIVFPNLLPAILSGVALSFARAVGEFGSVVLISGNIPFDTQVSAVDIFGQIETNNPGRPPPSRWCCSDLARRPAADRRLPPLAGETRCCLGTHSASGHSGISPCSCSCRWAWSSTARSRTASWLPGTPSRPRTPSTRLKLTLVIAAITVVANTVFGVALALWLRGRSRARGS